MTAHVSDFQFPWAAGWHFSQAVRAGDVIVTAGQAGFDDHGNFVSPDFEGQFRQAFRNLERVLRTWAWNPILTQGAKKRLQF